MKIGYFPAFYETVNVGRSMFIFSLSWAKQIGANGPLSSAFWPLTSGL